MIALESVVTNILFISVMGIVFWFLFWSLNYFGQPDKAAKATLTVAVLLVLIVALLGLTGQSLRR